MKLRTPLKRGHFFDKDFCLKEQFLHAIWPPDMLQLTNLDTFFLLVSGLEFYTVGV